MELLGNIFHEFGIVLCTGAGVPEPEPEFWPILPEICAANSFGHRQKNLNQSTKKYWNTRMPLILYACHKHVNIVFYVWLSSTSSLSLSKIAGVLNIARLDGSRRAMFFDCVKRYKIPISKRRNYKTNVILLSVREKVFLNEPIVTLSENIVLEIRRQHTRRARKHVLLEFLCKQSTSSL